MISAEGARVEIEGGACRRGGAWPLPIIGVCSGGAGFSLRTLLGLLGRVSGVLGRRTLGSAREERGLRERDL